MLPLPRGAVWQLLFLFCAALYINGVRSEGRVVCYYTNWSVYRPGTAKYNPQNINPYLCTHLIYAFGGFTKDNQMKPFDKYQDIEQGGYAKFTGLKTYNKQLKTMIAIGGWNEASSRFSPLVANPERRQKFIKNMLKFLRQNHFDGIDLDWEYPAHREGGKPRDKDNYAQFVQELRAEFEREAEKTGRPRLLVTMAVPAGIEYIEKGYDIPKLNKYLDWFNVLSYDFHSSHEPSVNHHAPLYSLEEESEYNYDSELNIDYSVKFYLNAGADKDKLVLGIPTYGRSYTLINEESTEIGAPAEAPGEQGDATREKGYLAYYEICQNIKDDPEWTVVQPNPNAMGPYAYRRNQWVGYDDEAIVRKKAQYVVDNGLGGIMFWAIDNDDFRGTCTGKPYPLIEAAKDAMLESLGLGINEVSKPSAPQKPSRSRSRENSSSTRNRITTSEQKLTYAERKGSTKRTQTTQQNNRNKIQAPTNEPEPFKLTEEEGSSLYIGGRTTTPPPPTTPDPGTDFKCEEEGFFQHPRDCKKYYWCLDSGPSGLGIVAHQFTCPSGLYFNPAADSCDFARNVPCKTKKSTTAAPITSPATTTTTTPRTTASINRITAATARTSLFRTTSTTTTTTEAPEEEIEYEEEEDNIPSPFAKNKGAGDKEAEEDPKVIKELIELIRKVGGIEELEKHLLRKDDGTIAIKENSSSSSSSFASTTPSSISKSLYEKVLSKPNALNSFRNRFTSTSSFRNTQTKTEIKAQDTTEEDEEESHEIDNKKSGATAGYSKYSSVVRGNSRQGPQNEGIDKLAELEGFQKEKKQYTTITRNRGNKKASAIEEDEEEESVISKSLKESHEDDEEGDVKTTKRPFTGTTPAYSTIRRTRPSTTTETAEEQEVEEEHEEEKEVSERKSYNTLNRSRVRGTTTTESPDVTEVTAGSTKYKYLERTRPTRPTTESSNNVNDDEDNEDEELEDHENTVQLKANANTRVTQQEITTKNTQRTYASIGRRTTTATPETETTTIAAKVITTTTATATPTTSTTETPITTPLTILEITTPESIITTTESNIPITTTTNPTTTTPTTTTVSTTSTKTTTLPNNGEDVLGSLATTTPYPNDINSDSEMLKLSLDVNSLLTDSTSSTSTSSSRTTESGLDTNKQESDSLLTTTTTTGTATETTATKSTTTEVNDIVPKTEDLAQNEEVNLVSKKKTKTLYTTRTRTTTTATPQTTTTATDIETTSSPTNTKQKPLGVRRQQVLLNRSSQTKTTTTTNTDIPTPTTESVNNDFLGTVSSPRPFGFPKRRTRPTASSSVSTTTTEEIVKPNDESLVIKQKTTKLNAAVNSTQTKVSSQNTILSQTASAETYSQQEHANKPSEESKVTQSTEHGFDKDTKVEHIKKHVVVQVDGLNINNNNHNNNNNNLRHDVNTVDSSSSTSSLGNSRIRTHTIVEEVDDDEDKGPHKSYSWRDARRPTKPTPKKKKLVVTEVTTEERFKQRVHPEHIVTGNVVENNEKDERFNKKEVDTVKYTGKYRGKSLESSVEEEQGNQVSEGTGADEEEGRGFRTYTTINRRRNQNKEQTTGIGENDETVTTDFKLTQVVRSGGEKEGEEELEKVTNTKYTSIKRGQSHQDEGDDEIVNSNIKYTTLNRGHTKQTAEDSETNENTGDSSLQIKFKYTTITRGQSSNTLTEDADSNSQKSTLNADISNKNTEEGSKTTTSEDSEGSLEKTQFKYTTINRGHSSNTATEGSDSKSDVSNLNLGHISKTEEDIETVGTQNSNRQEEDDTEGSDLKTKFKYTTITRGQATKTSEDTTKVENESSDDDLATTRFKYTKITRGQSAQGSTESDSQNTEENNETASGFKHTTTTGGQGSQKSEKDDTANTENNDKTTTRFKYTKITRGQNTQGSVNDNSENTEENNDSQTTGKFKYTTITRGQATKTSEDTANVATEGSDDDLETTRFKYTKITRGQSAQGSTENDSQKNNDNTSDFKYTKSTRGRGSQKSETEDTENTENNEKTSTRFKYTKITRGQNTQESINGDSENTDESNGSQTTGKSKYTTITRGHHDTSTNLEEDSKDTAANGGDNENTTRFKYTKVTRTQNGGKTSEEDSESAEDLKSKTYTTLSRNRDSENQQETDNENSSHSSSATETGKKTYTTITRNRVSLNNQQESQDSNGRTENSSVKDGSESNQGNVENQTAGKFKYTKVTREHITRGQGTQKTSDDNSKNTEANGDNNQTTTKFKYTKVTRTQNGEKAKEDDSENDEELKSKTYTSLNRNRGSLTQKETEEENSSISGSITATGEETFSSINRNRGSLKNQNESHDGTDSQESTSNTENKSYTTINRNRGSIKNEQESEDEAINGKSSNRFRQRIVHVSNTENIPYKAIVRGTEGIHLTEEELSGFTKNSGGSIVTTTEEKTEKSYQTISRGGQIHGISTNEETALEHSKIHEMEAMSLTHITEEDKKKTENSEKSTVEDEVLTVEIDETEPESSTEFTTTEEPSTTTSTTTEDVTTTTTTEEPLSSSTEEPISSSTEEVTTESTTEFVTPEVVTRRTLFRNRESSTSATTTTPEPTTRRSLFKNRGSVTTTEASSTESTAANEETEIESSTRRAIFRTRTTTGRIQEEATTQSPRRRTVLRRRPTSVSTQNSENSSGAESSLVTENSSSETEVKGDTETVKETISTKTITRGSYRPSEKGDLSSLLALDLAKKHGNKSQQTFGNGTKRKFFTKTSENETETENRARVTGSTSEQSSSTTETDNNGRRRTIIRKRIQTNKTTGSGHEQDTSLGNEKELNDSFSSESELKKTLIHENSEHTSINDDLKETLLSESELAKNSENSATSGSLNTDNQSSVISENTSSKTVVKGDTGTITETTSTQTITRGSYRPTEKGDLSSLLALDLAKKHGNKSQQTFGNGTRRKVLVKTNAETNENESDLEKRTRVTGEHSTTIDESVGQNGRRRTIIRKRIQTTKTSETEDGQNSGSTNTLLGKEAQLKDSSNSESELKETLTHKTETSENTSTGSDVELSKTESDKTESNIAGNVKANSFNSQTRKYAFANKRINENRATQNTETEKSAADIETNHTENSESQNEEHSEDNNISRTTGSKFNSRNSLNSQTKINSGQSAFSRTRGSFNTRLQNNRVKETEQESVDNETKNTSEDTDTESEQNSEDNNISTATGSKFHSRDSLITQTQENSRKSAFSSRRGAFNNRQQNNHGRTEEIETLEDGTTRIKTTHTETVNTGGTVKTIKRTKTKTILKQAPEYEYETEDIPAVPTTRRSITRQRGSVKFESNDLSSLLALDFASKANRKIASEQTVTKSRRKLIRKPDIITESEHVEEYEEELPTRPPRPSTSTEAPEPIHRRTRPTRPLRTTTPTTRATTKAPKTEEEQEVIEEDVISTTRRNFSFKRPINTKITKTEEVIKETQTESESEESTTKRNFAFRKPSATRRTLITSTEKPLKTSEIHTELENETVVKNTKVVNRFKFKQPTTTTIVEEITTTEASSTEEPTTTSTTTPETVPSTTESTTAESSSVLSEEFTTEILPTHDPLDILKNQLANAVNKLKSNSEEILEITETEVSDAINMKNKILTETDINLPIYHRRKYYQYYKDSPIVYVNPITLAPNTEPQANVDIAQQIHDVFNVSNDHLKDAEISEDAEAQLAKEQAQEINSELGNFLLNNPGSK